MTSLYNFRSVVICLLAFAAFRRFDELPKLFLMGLITPAANAGLPDRLFKRHGRWVSG